MLKNYSTTIELHPSTDPEPQATKTQDRHSGPVRIHNRKGYEVLLEAFDLLALVAAWYVTVQTRLLVNPLMSVQFSAAELKRLAPPLNAILLLWILAAVWLRLYRWRGDSSVGANLLRVAESAIVAGTLAIVVTFFAREFGADLSRSFVLLFLPVSFIMLMAAHYAALMTAASFERKWPSEEKVAVVGAGRQARRMVDHLRGAAHPALRTAGVILPSGASGEGLGSTVPVLGVTAQLAELINAKGIDRILLVDGCVNEAVIEECSRVATSMGVVVSRAIGHAGPDARLEFSELYGLHLLEVRPVFFMRSTELIKRSFDIVLSATILVAFLPLMALASALIKLTSKGPVLHKSMRVGKGGRHFTFLKFRSMCEGAEGRRVLAARNEQSGHLFKIRDDPRATPLGRIMRRYSIDELPQLVNVLLGQMSLVGPRPLPAEDLEPDGQSKQFAAWAGQRSRVLPGITGLWQVRGRSDLPFEKMMELDIDYIRNWSLGLDLKLLLETPFVALTGRGAY